MQKDSVRFHANFPPKELLLDLVDCLHQNLVTHNRWKNNYEITEFDIFIQKSDICINNHKAIDMTSKYNKRGSIE